MNKMKKTIILTLVTFLTFAMSFKAQAIEDPYPTGTIIGSAHFGFVPGIGANISGDYVLVDSWWKGHFTVGAYAGYNHRKWTSGNEYKYSNFAILPRATYGLNITNNFEVHAGALAGLGYRTYTYIDEQNKLQRGSQPIFEIGGFAGVRYRLVGNLYADAELNYTATMSYLNIGVSFVF